MARKAIPAFETEKEIFPVRLKELMEQTPKTSQQTLANVLGITRQAVANYQCGQSSPSWETIAKIAKYFHVSADYLLGLSAEDVPDQHIQSVCKFTGLSASTVEFLHCCPDRLARSFYRVFIDKIIQNGLSYDFLVVESIRRAAEAHSIWCRETEGADVKRKIKNTVNSLSDDGDCNYLISASEAEEFFKMRAIKELTGIVENALRLMVLDAIALRKHGDSIEDFEWGSLDENAIKELSEEVRRI